MSVHIDGFRSSCHLPHEERGRKNSLFGPTCYIRLQQGQRYDEGSTKANKEIVAAWKI